MFGLSGSVDAATSSTEQNLKSRFSMADTVFLQVSKQKTAIEKHKSRFTMLLSTENIGPARQAEEEAECFVHMTRN
jgi:hypothetical protein